MNFGLNINLDEFILRFIQRLRNDERVSTKPSLRQGIAIIQFLNARYHRKMSLSLTDLIDAAVKTTYYEDQFLAQEIADQTIYNLMNARIEEKKLLSYGTYRTMLEVNSIMAEYKSDPKIMEKIMEFDVDKMHDLRNLADLIFEEKKENLNLRDLQIFDSLGRLQQYLPEITSPENRTYAQNLLGDDQWKSNLTSLLTSDPSQMHQILNNLAEINADMKEVRQVLKESIGNLPNFEQYLQSLETSHEYIPPTQDQLSTIPEENFLPSLQTAKEMDQQYHGNLLREVFNEAIKQGKSFALEELLEFQHENPTWEQKLNEKLNNLHKNLNFIEKKNVIEKIHQIKHHQFNCESQQAIQSTLQSLADDVLQQIPDSEEFQQTLNQFMEEQIPFNSEKAMKIAQSKGFNLQNIQNLQKKDMQSLSNMIHRNLDDFDEYYDILKDIPMSNTTRDDLIQKGLSLKLPSLLGALGHLDLIDTAESIVHKGNEQDFQTLIQGLASGPGMNLMKIWFNSRKCVPNQIKEPLKAMIKENLISTSINFAKKYFGFIKKGSILESNELRMFRAGDSIDAIEIDETIANLIDHGKNLDKISSEDIISKKDHGQTIKVLLFIDTSGSMSGKKMLVASLSSLILLYLLNAKDFAIVTFESNTKEIKSFEDLKDIDNVAEILLSLTAQGGTQIGRSLEYLQTKLSYLPPNQKIYACFFSDLAVYESNSELIKYFKKLQFYRPILTLFSTEKVDFDKLLLFQRYLNMNHIPIPSVESIPLILAQALQQLK